MTSNFEKEIYQQPDVIARLVNNKAAEINELAEILRKKPPRFVLIAARGTSDNAAIYAKYLFTGINHIPAGLAMPSLHTLYQVSPDLSGCLVIGISQSGQTPDVRAVLETAQEQGVPTISITNAEQSPTATASEYAINLEAEEEKSVAASKTFTSQLTAVAMLSAYLSGDEERITAINSIPGYIEEVLEQRPAAEAIAARFSKKNHVAIVGRGFNYCTTHEIALKIKEMAYMVAQPYSAADFRHGPIAMLEPGFPVLAIAIRGDALVDMEAMIDSIRQTDADLAMMTNLKDLNRDTEDVIQVPQAVPDWLSPVVCTVPGQLLALHLALQKGINPDKPRGLTKVTLTY